jgi:regulatory protein
VKLESSSLAAALFDTMAGTITAIRVQEKNPRRANLYVDDQFVLGLSIYVVQDWGLRRGMSLSDADLEALRRDEKKQHAYNDALRLLNYRPRSVAEVRRRLRSRGYEEAQVEVALARLQRSGLLDDRAFARLWVENRLLSSPRGRQGLAAELRKKGVSAEVIAEVLDESEQDWDERAQAFELARGRVRTLAGLERPVFFRRLQSFLARRGFASDIVLQVVRQLWEETGKD